MKKIKKLLIITSSLGFSLAFAGSAIAGGAAPLPKVGGNCPMGYFTSGSQCKPSKDAKPAMIKKGSCPSGWSSSGSRYCLKN